MCRESFVLQTTNLLMKRGLFLERESAEEFAKEIYYNSAECFATEDEEE